jgi:hypothetical protein
MLILTCALAGCWTSATTPPANPHETVVTRDEAEKAKSGPSLIIPAANGTYTFRAYDAGQNHCADDLKTMLDERARAGATGPAPYCANMQVGPVTSHGREGLIW